MAKKFESIGARIPDTLRRRLGVWIRSRQMETNESAAIRFALERLCEGIDDPNPPPEDEDDAHIFALDAD